MRKHGHARCDVEGRMKWEEVLRGRGRGEGKYQEVFLGSAIFRSLTWFFSELNLREYSGSRGGEKERER